MMEQLPKPLMPIFRERLSFTVKDKRAVTFKEKQLGITRQKLFFALYLAGLLIAIVAGFASPKLFVISIILFITAMAFGVKSPKMLLEERKKKQERMKNIATSKGLMASDTPLDQAVKVLDWGEDYISPKKVEFIVRDEFPQSRQQSFMDQFNQIFGQETAWVPSDDKETGKPGWNYDEGKVTIHSVPPLPMMAPWDEHYILSEGIAWSFFPIGLGVENGVELPNPKTGEIENVLGFDVSGEQAKAGKNAGIKVAPSIVTSPMCLTGDTLIQTKLGVQPIRKISQLQNVDVLSYNQETQEFEYKEMTSTKKTRKDSDIIEVVFEDGSKVAGTPDHELLTDNGYVQIQELSKGSKIVGWNTDYKIVDKIVELDKKEDVYDGEVADNHNFVIVNGDNSGVVSSNCFVGGGTGGGKALQIKTPVKTIKKD